MRRSSFPQLRSSYPSSLELASEFEEKKLRPCRRKEGHSERNAVGANASRHCEAAKIQKVHKVAGSAKQMLANPVELNTKLGS
ncbi:MAG TPA: hypothetical protein VIS99_03225 [Terrimicrobiaceae bacterium]